MNETVAVGVISSAAALAGVLLTLLVQGLTERWRAGREREARLHTNRQELYSRYLRHAQTMTDWLNELGRLSDHAPEEVEVDGQPFESEAWEAAARLMVSEILLVGGKGVVTPATELDRNLVAWARCRIKHQSSGVLDLDLAALAEDEDYDVAFASEISTLQDSERQLMKAALGSYAGSLGAMRLELGAGDIA